MLFRLRIERDRLYKFSDYGGSQQAEEGALSRAEAYRTNATRTHRMVTVSHLPSVFASTCSHRACVQAARNAALSAPGSLYARGLNTSMHSPSVSHRSGSGSRSRTGTGTGRVSSEHARSSARSNHASLPRTPPYTEPLHMCKSSNFPPLLPLQF